MSATAAPPHSDGEDEEEYRRPPKRLKTAARQTEESKEGEDELEEGEEGEDSDSGSLPREADPALDHRARWTSGHYRGGNKVRAGNSCVSIRCSCQVTSGNRRLRAHVLVRARSCLVQVPAASGDPEEGSPQEEPCGPALVTGLFSLIQVNLHLLALTSIYG